VIRGSIILKSGDTLRMESEVFGPIEIPWEEIAAIRTDAPVYVKLSDDREVMGELSTQGDQLQVAGLTVALADVGEIRNEAEQETYQRLLAPGLTDLWAGYIDFGVILARGNAKTATISTSFNGTRQTNTDKMSAYFNQVYSRATIEGETQDTARAVRGGWGYLRNFNPRLFVSGFNDYEFDRFQNLDLRFVIGGGLGYTAIRTENMRLDLPAGFSYNREKFTDLVRNSAEVYWGDDFTHQVSGSTSIRQSLRVFNNFTNSGQYRVNFDVGATTNLNSWLAWQDTVSDRYLSNPRPERVKNDILITTWLRFTFTR
jgi:putative salt-induced outer membrane protein YdiY